MYRVAICDDNTAEGQQTLTLAKQVLLDRNLHAEFSIFSDPHDMTEHIRKGGGSYDLLLLDIVFDKTDGIQLAKLLREEGNRSAIIYTTTSPDYAMDGYKVQASDYLMKPIEATAFSDAIGRILRRQDTLFVEVDGTLKKIPVSEIHYAEAAGNYVILRTSDHTELARLRATLSETLHRLGIDRFARCHKGYIVHMRQIQEVRASQILLHSGDMIPLGRQYRAELQRSILDYVEKASPH